MKHTPVPWVDGNLSDAVVSKSHWETEEGWVGFDDVDDYYGGILIAESVAPNDKPLIKAAPDLLAACKMVLDWAAAPLDENGDFPHFSEHILPQVESAIAKATKETTQ